MAYFAGLDSTIVHGMWTAARARNLLDSLLHRSVDRRKSYEVKSCNVQFLDKIKPEEKLFAKVSHYGVKNGFKMLEVELKNENHVTVLKCNAEVCQPLTAFVFTGQGKENRFSTTNLIFLKEVQNQEWEWNFIIVLQ